MVGSMEEKFWKERRWIYEFIERKWTGRELKGWKHECMRWWVDEVSEGLFLTDLSLLQPPSPSIKGTSVLSIHQMNILWAPWRLRGKESACSAGDTGSIPVSGLGRSPGEGNGTPLQYSCLGNPMDRGASWATVRGVAESDTTEQLNNSNLRLFCLFSHLMSNAPGWSTDFPFKIRKLLPLSAPTPWTNTWLRQQPLIGSQLPTTLSPYGLSPPVIKTIIFNTSHIILTLHLKFIQDFTQSKTKSYWGRHDARGLALYAPPLDPSHPHDSHAGPGTWLCLAAIIPSPFSWNLLSRMHLWPLHEFIQVYTQISSHQRGLPCSL